MTDGRERSLVFRVGAAWDFETGKYSLAPNVIYDFAGDHDLLCLVAGLVARTVAAQRLVNRLENSLLGRVPAYGLLKSAAEGVAGLEDDESLIPVVVRLDDSTVLGLMTAQQERVHTVAVYVPRAPSALSGSVLYVERARVTRLEAGAQEVFGAMKQLGRESLDLLAGTPGAGAVA